MAATTSIVLYYDVISPYSWIAFEILCRYRRKWNIALEFKPFLLGGIMKESGNRAPGTVPLKANYMGIDLMRLAQYYHIPLRTPSNVPEVMFVKGSLSAQRLLTSAKELCPDKLEELSRQLWVRVWSQDKDITLIESLTEACYKSEISKDTTEELLASISSQPIKDKLKAVTMEAVDYGAFGSPFIVAEVNGKSEIFFGQDRFEIMAYVIGEKWYGPLNELKAKY